MNKYRASKLLLALLAAGALLACGGSDNPDIAHEPAPGLTDLGDQPALTPEPSPEPAATAPEPVLSPEAPNDNLDAPTPVTASASTYCGYSVGPKRLSGVVSSVVDGDTIKIGSRTIRLDSIDAPEMSQTYGPKAKSSLSSKLNGRSVTVAYAKTDRYGRVVGSVFDSPCNLINLQQVREGSAWYYEAYRCELGVTERNLYARAQEEAQAASRGLWAFDATPPWEWRNGVPAEVPNCSSDGPSWGTLMPAATPPTYTPPATPSPSTPTPAYTPPSTQSCQPIWVSGYRRSNGTYVRGHWRRPPGCAS